MRLRVLSLIGAALAALVILATPYEPTRAEEVGAVTRPGATGAADPKPLLRILTLAGANTAGEAQTPMPGQSCIGEGQACVLNGTACCNPFRCKGKFPNTTCQ